MWPAQAYSPGKTQESYDKQPFRDWLQSSEYRTSLTSLERAALLFLLGLNFQASWWRR